MSKLNCSLNDTSKLRKMILENPELPLLIFVGEEAHKGNYGYEQTVVNNCEVEELTIYSDMWVDKEEYTDQLHENLSDEEEYKGLTDEEYSAMIDKMVEETEFVKAIVVWVG